MEFGTNQVPILLSADGRLAITYTRTGFILIWELTAANPAANVRSLRTTPPGTNPLPLIAIHPNSTILAVSSGTSLRLFSLTEADPATSEVVLGGLSATINTLVFSPDGRWLSVGTNDGIVHLWDLLSADVIGSYQALFGHTEGLYSMTFRPDSQILASSAGDGIRLWLLPTSAALSPDIFSRLLPGGSGPIVFRPDGQTLLTESGRRVWDLNAPSYTPAMQFMLRDRRMDGPVLFSPDGSLNESVITFWDLHADDPEATRYVLEGPEFSADDLFFLPDGHTLVGIGNLDGNIYFWDLSHPDPNRTLHLLPIPFSGLRNVMLAPDGKTLGLVGNPSGLEHPPLFLVDLTASDANASTRILRTYEDTWNLVFSPDMRTMISGAFDHGNYATTVQGWTLNVRDLIAPACQAIGRNFYASEWRQYFGNTPYRKTCPDEPVPREPFTARTPMPEAEASAALTPTAARPATPSPLPDANQSAVPEATALPTRTATVLSGSPAPIGTRTLTPRSFAREGALISNLALAPDGVAFAIQEEGGPLLLRRMSDGTVLQRLEAGNQPFWSVHFNPDGQYLAAGTLEGTIVIWRTSDGTLFNTLTEVQCPCAFAPDGQSLAAFAGSGSLTSWRVSDGAPVQSFGGAIDPIQVKFAPDGQTITMDTHVKLWNVNDGSSIGELDLGMELEGDWISLRYSPDGRLHIIYGLGTNTVWLWE